MMTQLDLPRVDCKIYALGFDFLRPYLEPFAEFVQDPEEADFLLTMNHPSNSTAETLAGFRRPGRPLVWWTIEDPNWFEMYIGQAAIADVVLTTDEACIPRYRERLGHDRVFWVPLACSPEYHRPLALAEDATDFVISANWYPNEARQWGVKTVVDPLLAAGYNLTIYCYASFMWPPEYRAYWKGETHFRTTAEQYRHGRVVLGVNNQRSGMDGVPQTLMTSMRTFEALGCGKPFLAAHSDAYHRLGFGHGEHMAWVDSPAETLAWAERLLASEGVRIAQSGRSFVLAHHTYAHRLSRVAELVLG